VYNREGKIRFPPRKGHTMHPSAHLSRRQLLRAGTIGCLGLSLPQLLRAEQMAPKQTKSADACILVFLDGGPSHLDMWDMKPNAPAEIRGEFKPIATSAPGIQLSEHLPRLAKSMHRATIIRSAHHGVNNSHAAAVYAALTGHDRGEAGGGTRPAIAPAAPDHPNPDRGQREPVPAFRDLGRPDRCEGPYPRPGRG